VLKPSAHWDIFCSVIDNYGDIGVTWRLSRQLANEFGIAVRLWVDDLQAFRSIRPEIDGHAATQRLNGVEIRQWTNPLPSVIPGEVVIEALACHIPDAYIQTMAALSPKPVWLNLEYLSAENWVSGVHGLPSPHPRLPLTKYFFMPGYATGTGGLTRESNLFLNRERFQSDPTAQSGFWKRIGLPDKDPQRLRISLFSYESASLPDLLAACAGGDHPVDLLVPKGRAIPQIAAWFSSKDSDAGDRLERGSLRVHILPMLPQDDYDMLLWACDLNIVRGEDSFVRAQFAARPMLWQAYIQDKDAHLDKVDAFLDLYCADLPPAKANLVRASWRAWNRQEEIGPLWPSLLTSLPYLAAHARAWATHLADQTDLSSNLVKFINKLLESRAF